MKILKSILLSFLVCLTLGVSLAATTCFDHKGYEICVTISQIDLYEYVLSVSSTMGDMTCKNVYVGDLSFGWLPQCNHSFYYDGSNVARVQMAMGKGSPISFFHDFDFNTLRWVDNSGVGGPSINGDEGEGGNEGEGGDEGEGGNEGGGGNEGNGGNGGQGGDGGSGGNEGNGGNGGQLGDEGNGGNEGEGGDEGDSICKKIGKNRICLSIHKQNNGRYTLRREITCRDNSCATYCSILLGNNTLNNVGSCNGSFSYNSNSTEYLKIYITINNIDSIIDGYYNFGDGMWSSNNGGNYDNYVELNSPNEDADIGNWVKLNIETNPSYVGIISFYKIQYKASSSSSRTTISNRTNSTYFSDYSSEWEQGYYNMKASDNGEKTISNFLKFAKKGYYRIYAKDTNGNEDYILFDVDGSDNNSSNDSTNQNRLLSLSTTTKNVTTSNYVNLKINTDGTYNGKVYFSAKRLTIDYDTYWERRGWCATYGATCPDYWQTISITDSKYFKSYSSDWSKGYISMNNAYGVQNLTNLFKFASSGYYDIYVEDENGNKSHIEFSVRQGYYTDIDDISGLYSGDNIVDNFVMENEAKTTDKYNGSQYYLGALNIYEAREKLPKNKNNVVIAVIDDGVYLNHPDLSNSLWINSGEIPSNNKDDDKNGYKDDYNGWDFVYKVNPLQHISYHGTMVAGIISATSNNSEGIAGIVPKAKIMPLIVCKNGCDDKLIIDAMKYAINNGADIINISLGGNQFNFTYEFDNVIKEAYNKGIIVVIAAGNGDILSSSKSSPSTVGLNTSINKVSPVCNESNNKKSIIGVGALSKNYLTKINRSNYGDCVDFYAPGEKIVTTSAPIYGTNYQLLYEEVDGTSFSSPMIAGIVGLGYNKYGKVPPDIVYNALQKSISGEIIDAAKYLDNLQEWMDELKKSVTWLYGNRMSVYSEPISFMHFNGLRRDEASKFFVRYAKDVLGKQPDTSKPCKFSDLNQAWPDLKDIVVEACQLGLFQGYKGKFMPTDKLTNAQALAVFIRMIDGRKDESGSHFGNEYYERAKLFGLIDGLSLDNNFNFDGPTTRGDVAIMMYRRNSQ